MVCVKDAANNLTKYPPVTVVVDRQGPAAVENLTIVGGSRQATLDWQVGQDAGDAGIQGYNVRYGGFSDLSGVWGNDVGNVTTFVLTGLNDRATYYLQVAARDKAGNLGP